MRYITRLLPIPLLTLSVLAEAKVKDNIVIKSNVDTYTLVASKKADSIETIRRELVTTFEATRAPEDGIAYVYYDDFVKLNKASVKARGVKPVYKSATSAGIFHDDSRVCILDVPLTEVNKPVETRFELTYVRPDIEPGIMLRGIYPMERQTVVFNIPVDYKDRYDVAVLNADSSMTITRGVSDDGKYATVTITGKDIPAKEYSNDGPPVKYTAPYALLRGRFSDAQELYRHLRAYTLTDDSDSMAVKEKALEITAECDNDTARAREIYRWVNENIRYVAIENGDLGHRPDVASSVLAKRYGDCKGSANLIKEMLRAVGLDGRLVWIGTVDIPYEFTDIPGYSAGNHMIAGWVTPSDSIIYLDGTVGCSDFGHTGSGIAGKQTLVENGNCCIIGRVPTVDPEENIKDTSYSLSIKGLNLEGNYTCRVTGDYKASLLNAMNTSEPSDHPKIFTRFIKEGRPQWSTPNILLSKNLDSSKPLYLMGPVSIERAVRKAGNKTYVTINMMPSLASLTFDTKDREDGGWLAGSRHRRNSYTINIPAEYTVGELPKPLKISNKWIDSEIIYELMDENSDSTKVKVSVDLIIKSRYIPLEDIEKFNADTRQLARAANAAVIITEKSTN